MRTGWVQWREGDSLYEEYTTPAGQVVRSTWFGWFSTSQVRARAAWSERLSSALSSGALMSMLRWSAPA